LIYWEYKNHLREMDTDNTTANTNPEQSAPENAPVT